MEVFPLFLLSILLFGEVFPSIQASQKHMFKCRKIKFLAPDALDVKHSISSVFVLLCFLPCPKDFIIKQIIQNEPSALAGMVSEKLINAAETLCTFELQTQSIQSLSASPFTSLGQKQLQWNSMNNSQPAIRLFVFYCLGRNKLPQTNKLDILQYD